MSDKKEKKHEYSQLPEGPNLMGLIKVKDVEVEDRKNETTRPGHMLVFRSKEDPKAFFTVKFPISNSPKSKMFQVLRAMSGFKFKEGATIETLSKFIEDNIGRWFTVIVEHKVTETTTYVNLVGHQITPAVEKGDAVLYFNDLYLNERRPPPNEGQSA